MTTIIDTTDALNQQNCVVNKMLTERLGNILKSRVEPALDYEQTHPISGFAFAFLASPWLNSDDGKKKFFLVHVTLSTCREFLSHVSLL